MLTELEPGTVARLAVAALEGDPGEGAIVLDPATGALAARPAAFRELVEPGSRLEERAALAAAGAVRGGRLHPVLRAGVGAVRTRQAAVLERAGAPTVEVWATPPAAALTAVDPAGRVRLVPLPSAALAAALERLCGFAGEGAAAPGGERRLSPADLAAELASDRPHTHVRFVAAGDVFEAVGAEDGWRAIEAAADGSVVVRPQAPAALRRALAALLQRS